MDKLIISSEKKLTLILLCWLIGIFGAHRFYIGKYRSGGLQLSCLGLAVLWGVLEVKPLAAIPGIVLLLWWVIDVLLIIMGKFTDKEGKPIIDWL
jgi:TM2 domain-containing membrane protein YozV